MTHESMLLSVLFWTGAASTSPPPPPSPPPPSPPPSVTSSCECTVDKKKDALASSPLRRYALHELRRRSEVGGSECHSLFAAHGRLRFADRLRHMVDDELAR